MEAQRVPVLERHRFDEAALDAYLRKNVPAIDKPITVLQFQGGQSNPTFFVESGENRFVIRKKPPGDLLPSAHQVDREYKVITALENSGVPVPKTHVLCEDKSVIGTEFYVMDFVEGRVTQDRTLPDVTPAERHALYLDMVRIMAALHAVDYEAVGLGDFGRAGGYVARQIKRWSGLYEQSKTGDHPHMVKLTNWVRDNIPTADETTVIHGDFRLGNCLIHPTEPRIVAVLDWELSTLGHPIAADLAYNSMGWYQGVDTRRPTSSGLAHLDLAAHGIPSMDAYLAEYLKHSGRDHIPDWDYYMAFSFFRSAAIVDGVYARGLQGNNADPTALLLEGAAEETARIGWQFAVNAGAG